MVPWFQVFGVLIVINWTVQYLEVPFLWMCEYCSWLPRQNVCINILYSVFISIQIILCLLIIVALLRCRFSRNFFFFLSSILLSLLSSTSLLFVLQLARWIIFASYVIYYCFIIAVLIVLKSAISNDEKENQVNQLNTIFKPSAVTVN